MDRVIILKFQDIYTYVQSPEISGCLDIVIVVGVVKNDQGVGQNQLRRTFSSAADAGVGQARRRGRQNKTSPAWNGQI